MSICCQCQQVQWICSASVSQHGAPGIHPTTGLVRTLRSAAMPSSLARASDNASASGTHSVNFSPSATARARGRAGAGCAARPSSAQARRVASRRASPVTQPRPVSKLSTLPRPGSPQLLHCECHVRPQPGEGPPTAALAVVDQHRAVAPYPWGVSRRSARACDARFDSTTSRATRRRAHAACRRRCRPTVGGTSLAS